jgi:hypothetical protein
MIDNQQRDDAYIKSTGEPLLYRTTFNGVCTLDLTDFNDMVELLVSQWKFPDIQTIHIRNSVWITQWHILNIPKQFDKEAVYRYGWLFHSLFANKRDQSTPITLNVRRSGTNPQLKNVFKTLIQLTLVLPQYFFFDINSIGPKEGGPWIQELISKHRPFRGNDPWNLKRKSVDTIATTVLSKAHDQNIVIKRSLPDDAETSVSKKMKHEQE